jgi:two-component system, LytTR family, response regulator LytT
LKNKIDILIVEDEALIAQKMKMQLEDFGYNIAAICYDYETAIKAIKDFSFDVVITDINLGDGIHKKSGLHIAQQVKQINDCPIIFLTAFSDKDTIKKATSLSPSAYLVKPVNAVNLYATVQVAVDNFEAKKSPTIDTEETPQYFFVKIGNKFVKIFWNDVYHLEAIKNYVKITTTQQSNTVLVSGSLQQLIQNMLPQEYKKKFTKINRAEAVSKSIIKKIGKGFIETDYGQFKTSIDFRIEDL